MSEADPRIEAILEVLLAFARHDFTRKAPLTDERDAVDAIAAGLNMLAEELHGHVVSRDEVEVAYAAMKQAQARLVHGGKLVAIGQLACSVAHEISNPAMWTGAAISGIERAVGQVESTLDDPALSDDARRARLRPLLDRIRSSAVDAGAGVARIAEITRDLRRFARVDDGDVARVLLSDAIRWACKLARPLVEQGVELELQLHEELAVQASRGRLAQVVTNLLVNATQAAAPAGLPCRVRIELTDEAGLALLAVDDSGPGVPMEYRHRVFEPFFTTKAPDEGTGLGLSLVADIVKEYGGTVRVVDSALGGARFEVRLPLARESRPPR